MLSKEEIEKAKGWLSALDIKSEFEAISKEIILQYIAQLEQENDKQSKIIDEMAVEIASYDNDETFCKEVYPNNSCEGNGISYWECIKQYFEKKVEGK